MANSLWHFGLLFTSLLGWGLLTHYKLRINVAFIPIFLFSSITATLFCAGLLNILPLMANLIFFGGLILSLIFSYLLIRKKTLLKVGKLFCPSTIFFMVAIVYLMILLKGVYLTHYDNFSHWALIVKEMYLMDGLPDRTTVISFKNYPPGTAVFIYYILKIVGFAESYSLMAQGFLIVACLTVLFVFTSWKKPLQLTLTLIVAFILITINTESIFNLLVDTVLGMLAFTSAIITYYYRNNWKKIVQVNTPILILLVLVKDSGKLFLALNIILIIFFIHHYELNGKLSNIIKTKMLLKTTSLVLLIPIFLSYLWVKYTQKVYDTSYSENKFALNFEKFNLQSESDELKNTLFPKMIDQFIDTDSSLFQIYFWLNIGMIVVAIVLAVLKKKTPKRIIFTFLYTNGAFLAYILSLFLMYLFLMPYDEAINLASYSRYLTTIILYFGGITMTTLVLELSGLNKGLNKTALTALIAVLFLFPINSNNAHALIQKPDLSNSIRTKVKPAVEKILSQGEPNPWIMYYSPQSKNDYGYLLYVALYDQLSKNYIIAHSCNTEEEQRHFLSGLTQSNYVVVLENDLSSCMNTFIPAYASEGVYKVVKENDEISLELLE